MRYSYLVAILALAFGVPALRAQTSSLPELPQVELTDFPSAVREQVQEAYAAARAHPKDADANGKLGMLLDLYERHESAAVCYQRAHLLEPGSFRWLYYLGSLQAAQGKRGEAAVTLRSALRLNPDYLPARLKLAETLLATGKLEESGNIYAALVKRHPDSAEAQYGLGRIHAARGDLVSAVASYRKACEFFPPYGAAHYALALAYRKLKETEKSRQHMRRYEENKNLVPPLDDPLGDAMRELDLGAASHLRRGVALEQVGRLEDSVAAHEKALQLDPKLVTAHVNLIALYGRLGRPEKAEEHYRAAVSLNPNQFANIHYYYGVLLLGQGKYQEAEQAFRQALQVNPFYAEAHNNLGALLERQGRLEEALREFRKASENRPDFRLAHFHIGRILANQKKYNEAIEHFLKTLTPEDESTPTYLYALAATYARAGDGESALSYYRRAREQAVARGQTQLLTGIDRDLRILEDQQRRR